MSVKNPRIRLVNFRLSEQEYEWIKRSCQESGSRSISEFARTAVLRTIRTDTANPHLARLDDLARRVAELESRLQQFFGLVVASDASPERSALDCATCDNAAKLSRLRRSTSQTAAFNP
jgi:hypothetical protein